MIFAGSGSGKTVLLRRMVEECALHGVSAIVLDPNNDLARMGDAWPERPAGWGDGDAEKAREYLANTEVVVWTPGRAGGRPLSFQPLPDFESVREDADEFQAAVEAAVARLVPHAGLTGAAKAALRGKAVLREALTYYARRGKRDLAGFVETLAELPEGVSKLSTAVAMAADLAETLRAAMVNDPLLGGSGTPTDPELLLTPSEGKRARVSVISFVGLPADEQRQGFVSQLQLEVFAWAKRNPAVDRPLGGLIVMDEAQTIAPSGNLTASTQSTILLASQARKYGLGLILATQAPKGVHNQIVGNATTQFFGRLNSPAQIAAATEMARAKGSTVADISRLERGQFYATGEKFGFRKIRTPLCLSHHPPSPLRLEEVLDRAHE
jgi:DNA helicase HerA-like ATPase